MSLLKLRYNIHLAQRLYSAFKGIDIKNEDSNLSFKTKLDKHQLKIKLTPLQYDVTQNHGTEKPFSGEYNHNKSTGTFECVSCDQALFSSQAKYESHSGWPSFYDTVNKANLTYIRDATIGVERIEVRCSNCGSHLGHVFEDGPKPTNLRYCINSAALNLRKNSPDK